MEVPNKTAQILKHQKDCHGRRRRMLLGKLQEPHHQPSVKDSKRLSVPNPQRLCHLHPTRSPRITSTTSSTSGTMLETLTPSFYGATAHIPWRQHRGKRRGVPLLHRLQEKLYARRTPRAIKKQVPQNKAYSTPRIPGPPKEKELRRGKGPTWKNVRGTIFCVCGAKQQHLSKEKGGASSKKHTKGFENIQSDGNATNQDQMAVTTGERWGHAPELSRKSTVRRVNTKRLRRLEPHRGPRKASPCGTEDPHMSGNFLHHRKKIGNIRQGCFVVLSSRILKRSTPCNSFIRASVIDNSAV